MVMSLTKRFLATSPAVKKTNWLMWVGVPSLAASAGAYYAYSSSSKPASSDSIKIIKPQEYLQALNGEWREFKLKKVAKNNHNVSTFTFALPEGCTDLGLPVAAALVTKFKPTGEEKPVIRPYTPVESSDVTDPKKKKEFDLVIKQYPGGKMSSHIHSMKVGETLEMKGPNLKYQYIPNKEKHIGMVAGGSGITPMLQVLQKIANDPTDKTKVDLIFANVEEKDLFLQKELDEQAAKKPDQIKIHYKLDKPPAWGWKGLPDSGYIDAKLIKKLLPQPGQGIIFVCGPPGQVTAIAGPKAKDYTQGEVGGILKELGYTKEQVFKF